MIGNHWWDQRETKKKRTAKQMKCMYACMHIGWPIEFILFVPMYRKFHIFISRCVASSSFFFSSWFVAAVVLFTQHDSMVGASPIPSCPFFVLFTVIKRTQKYGPCTNHHHVGTTMEQCWQQRTKTKRSKKNEERKKWSQSACSLRGSSASKRIILPRQGTQQRDWTENKIFFIHILYKYIYGVCLFSVR